MPQVRRFKTREDVRKAIAYVWRKVEGGELPPDIGRLLVSCGTLLHAIVRDDKLEALEARLKALEGSPADEPKPESEDE